MIYLFICKYFFLLFKICKYFFNNICILYLKHVFLTIFRLEGGGALRPCVRSVISGCRHSRTFVFAKKLLRADKEGLDIQTTSGTVKKLFLLFLKSMEKIL